MYKKICPKCGSKKLRISVTMVFNDIGFDIDSESGDLDYNIADSSGSEEEGFTIYCEANNCKFQTEEIESLKIDKTE
jgi:hypothetical protein